MGGCRQVPPAVMASYRFHGKSPDEATLERKKGKLLAILQASNLQAQPEDMTVYQYHPRSSPGMLRVNEILIPVTYGPQEVQLLGIPNMAAISAE